MLSDELTILLPRFVDQRGPSHDELSRLRPNGHRSRFPNSCMSCTVVSVRDVTGAFDPSPGEPTSPEGAKGPMRTGG